MFYINDRIVDMALAPCEEDGTVYIPFDTKSDLKKLANMYYEWNYTSETLTIYGEKTAVFTKDSDIVIIDGQEMSLKKPLSFLDGIPLVQADILCDILGMEIRFGKFEVRLNSK